MAILEFGNFTLLLHINSPLSSAEAYMKFPVRKK
jgi:hypothetical protein